MERPFIFHLQRFAVVTLAAADVAGDVDVRQEVHFDALESVALAGFAASPFDVETESAGFVSALARLRQHRVEIANGRKDARVRGRIGARRAADGRLIDFNNLVDMLQAGDGAVCAGLGSRIVDVLRERAV